MEVSVGSKWTAIVTGAMMAIASGVSFAQEQPTQMAQAAAGESSFKQQTAILAQAEQLSAPSSDASSFEAKPGTWNDTYIGYRYGTNFRYPGVQDHVTQNIGFVTTAGEYRYGSYFFDSEYIMSDGSSNPASGGPNSGGANEVYAVGRVEFSAGKILGKNLGVSVFRDFGFTTGFDFGSKNDAYAQGTRILVFGPTVEFAVPRGFWNLTVGVRTESNHNGIIGVAVHYNPAWHIESSWLYPFRIGPVPMVLRGFAQITGPKGRDGFGVETTTEYLTRVSLLADVGALLGHPRTFFLGGAYQYWHHAYGLPTSEIVGTTSSVPMIAAEIHF